MPGHRLVNEYAPVLVVVKFATVVPEAFTTALPLPSTSPMTAPATPFSPASRTPLPLVSTHTKSPIVDVLNIPASSVLLISSETRVIGSEMPVVRFTSESVASVAAEALSTVLAQPLGLVTRTLYVPGTRLGNEYSPPPAVTAVIAVGPFSTGLLALSSSSTVTPSTPSSPDWRTPSPFTSSQTRSPRVANLYSPASIDMSFTPEFRVIDGVMPVAGTGLESVAAGPAPVRLNCQPTPAGGVNLTR